MKDSGYTLGLDIGTNSVGWAVIRKGEENELQDVVSLGAHIFDSVLESSDIERGKGETKNADRRNARQLRRQYERRRQRKNRLFNRLKKHGLLEGEDKGSVLKEIDAQIRRKYFGRELSIPAVEHTMPYFIRKAALDTGLELSELGRAIYHLAQRRGFLSNRKVVKDDDEGEIKTSISELQEDIEKSGSRTLGEYFARLDPEVERIRQRYTSRSMYIHEFKMIWEKQKEYYPDILTDEAYKDIYNSIFYQRPLRSVKHLVGECSLEKGEKKAPFYRYEAQRFRMLQRVNDLDIRVNASGEIKRLSEEERALLISELERGDLAFVGAKKLLGYKRTDKFNLELMGDKRLIGNRINADMISIFGEEWLDKSPEVQAGIIIDINSINSNKALKNRAKNHYRLSAEQIEALLGTAFEEGYCGLSLKALKRLLPHMEEGVQFAAARKIEYPESFEAEKVLDELPMTLEAMPGLRNPIVLRSLNELRKLVNLVIAEYGKPGEIIIELGRDIKNSAKERDRIFNANNRRKERRSDIEKLIRREVPEIIYPSRTDVEKVLLADECNWRCPYTGKGINFHNLFVEPEYDIEHIIPFSRSLDDSFMNKTLCYHHENRNVKRNMTPFEAYAGSGKKWDDMLMRVEKFKMEGGRKNEKLRRFKLEKVDDLEEFSSRQLNDTRYASKLAMEYLGLLYGGSVDSGRRRRIFAGNGRITALLRGLWGLNDILGQDGKKSRADHRHHAVDALVTALLSPEIIKRISSAASRVEPGTGIFWKQLRSNFPEPTADFKNLARCMVDGIVVSHRVSRKVRGQLHKETIYSKGKAGRDGRVHYHKRLKVEALTANSIKDIADPRVREAVERRLEELGESDPKKAFAAKENHPLLYTPKRRQEYTPIHKVRISTNDNPVAVGKGRKTKYVEPGNNHHIEIFEVLEPEAGMVKTWNAEVISLLEARQRMLGRIPVVNREHGENTRFVCSLCGGDIIQLTNSDGKDYLYRVRAIKHIKASGQIQIAYVPIYEARPLKEISRVEKAEGLMGENKICQTLSPSSMLKRSLRKVVIDALGRVRRAND